MKSAGNGIKEKVDLPNSLQKGANKQNAWEGLRGTRLTVWKQTPVAGPQMGTRDEMLENVGYGVCEDEHTWKPPTPQLPTPLEVTPCRTERRRRL